MQLQSDALNEAAAWPCAGQRTLVVLASQLMAAELYQEGFDYFAARSDSTPTDAHRRGPGDTAQSRRINKVSTPSKTQSVCQSPPTTMTGPFPPPHQAKVRDEDQCRRARRKPTHAGGCTSRVRRRRDLPGHRHLRLAATAQLGGTSAGAGAVAGRHRRRGCL